MCLTRSGSLIESLMYLAVSTRPDIGHAVSIISQYNSNYGTSHWTAAKRVLRYLKDTENLGLIFRKSNQDLTSFADVDWRSNVDQKFYTGYAFCLGAIS